MGGEFFGENHGSTAETLFPISQFSAAAKKKRPTVLCRAFLKYIPEITDMVFCLVKIFLAARHTGKTFA
jgi:hypothetical protein